MSQLHLSTTGLKLQEEICATTPQSNAPHLPAPLTRGAKTGRCGIVGVGSPGPRDGFPIPYNFYPTPVQVRRGGPLRPPKAPPLGELSAARLTERVSIPSALSVTAGAVPPFARRETAPLLSALQTFFPAIGGNLPRGRGMPTPVRIVGADSISARKKLPQTSLALGQLPQEGASA